MKGTSCTLCSFSSTTYTCKKGKNHETNAMAQKLGFPSKSLRGPETQQSLLHYFSSSSSASTFFVKQSLLPQSRPFPSFSFPSSLTIEPIKQQLTTCTHCDRAICASSAFDSSCTYNNCSIVCQWCSMTFCTTSCSTINYSKAFERVYCLDCHEQVTLMEEHERDNDNEEKRAMSTTAMGTNDDMMIG